MGKNQLADEGAIIGYQPDLTYRKNRNNQAEIPEDSAKKEEQQTILDRLAQNSSACRHFYENMPGKTITVLNTVSSELRTLMDGMSTAFANGKWNQYGNIESLLSAIDFKNDEYIKKFVDFHRYNITGSLVPELIEAVYDTQKRIDLVSSTLKRLYYDKKYMSEDEMSEADTEYVKKIAEYENSDESQHINYVAISNDALLNRTTMLYAYSVNASCSALSEIISAAEPFEYTNRSKIDSIKKLYLEVNDELDYREDSYQHYQTVEILEKTLYNYYYKRQELLDLYDVLGPNSSVFFVNEIIKKQDALNEAIETINRAYMGNKSHIDELKRLEEEKYYLLNIYGQLSTIS